MKIAMTRKQLGEVCEVMSGNAWPASKFNYIGNGLPIVRIQNLGNNSNADSAYWDHEYPSEYLLAGGELLLSLSGSFKVQIWSGPKSLLNQRIMKLTPRNGLLVDYLYFLLQARIREIEGASTSTAIKNTSLTWLRSMELCYPTTAEQERVVGCIKECLSRVEEMQRLRKEALAESERLEERLLGEIEESLGGCRVPLGQLLDDTQNGKSLQNKETSHNGRALTLSAVRRHRLDLSASKPAQINRGCDEKYLVRAGDVFISRSNTRELVARSAIALERTGEPTIFSDLLIRLTPKPKVVRPFYLVIALRMPRVRHQLQSNAIGSSQTMVKISGERLRTVEIPCPSATEQECIEIKYAKADSAVSTIMDELSAQESELNFVRESILREAFAGNL